MRSLLAIICAVFLSGCVSLRSPRPEAFVSGYAHAPPTPAECRGWDEKRLSWGTIGTVAGVLSGSSGAVATLTPLARDDNTRLALGITSLVLAGVVAASTFRVESYTERYTTQCLTPP